MDYGNRRLALQSLSDSLRNQSMTFSLSSFSLIEHYRHVLDPASGLARGFPSPKLQDRSGQPFLS